MKRREQTLGRGLVRFAAAGLWWSAIGLCAIPQVTTRTGIVADWFAATAFFAALFVLPAFILEVKLIGRRPPRHIPITLLAAMGLSCVLLFNTTNANTFSFVIAALLNLACLVTLASLFADAPWLGWLAGRVARHRRWAALCGPVALVGFVAFAAWPGPDTPAQADGPPGAAIPAINASNPGAMGAYTYTRLTYGPPDQDGRADVISRRVDGSAIIPDWNDTFLDARARYWGFEANRLPLAGTIWLPAGAGPFPLMLIAHGQTAMMAPSDQGFAYLGEFLASRGYIAAAVDANFLNANWYAIMWVPGLMLQDDFGARGWLLSEHLKQWHDWEVTPGNVLHGKIDLQQVALIGHSRGGEAIALVADYLRRYGQPPDTKVRALVSLSPTDANFLPGGERVRLSGLDYLVISSGYDGDVISALGMNQFQRVAVGPDDSGPEDYFKASVFLEHATHNGFNSVWDGSNAPLPGALLTNRAPLMPERDQRLATKVFIGAFLEDSLRHQKVFESVFRDHRTAGAWLPASAAYRSKFVGGADFLIDDFEDTRADTPTVPGGHNRTTGPVRGSEGQAPLRSGVNGPSAYHESKAAFLAWQQPGGTYETTLPVSVTTSWGAGPGGALAINLAHATRLTEIRLANEVDKPLDFTVFIRDASGNEGRLLLSRHESLPPPVEVRLFKVDLFPARSNIFSQYHLPLTEFKATGKPVELGRLAAVGLRFDRSAAGAVLVDDIALTKR